MRPILLLFGISMVATAVIAYQPRPHSSASQTSASTRLVAPAPTAIETPALQQALSVGRDTPGGGKILSPGEAAPSAARINLAPKGKPKGARFVKPPTAD